MPKGNFELISRTGMIWHIVDDTGLSRCDFNPSRNKEGIKKRFSSDYELVRICTKCKFNGKKVMVKPNV